ncbi:MAG TPA: vWA domain-containing protein [Gemmataceae bacterium]|nr:vWA domain-containing protein [Gemmataceae bacterium]
MPYAAEINRTNPTCFVFLVDHSSSMLEPFGGQPEKQKSEGVADAINRLLQNLILKCAKSDGIRDYFYVGVIGYGGRVVSALGGSLAGQTLVPISAIANNPLRVEQRTRKVDDGAGGLLEQKFKFPLWVEAKATGRTPMCEALKLAKQYLEVFLARFDSCYPPLVINITDGMATDGDPLSVAQSLQQLASTDGNVLLFNAHVSERQALAIEFPSAEANLPDNFAKLLFRISSPLPPRLFDAARADKFPVQTGARGFVFNADLVSIIRFLDIGTRVATTVR